MGVLGPNSADWLLWAVATWMVGGVLAPISYPLRIRDRALYSTQLATMMSAIDCRLVAAHPKYVPFLPGESVVSWETGLPGTSAPGEFPATPDDPAVIQFTSGSTAQPKAAVLTNRAVLAGLRAMATRTGIRPGSEGLGWLPFFHDNGLFAHALMGLAVSGTSHVLPTERFASHPGLWLSLLSDLRAAQATSGPISAWGMAMRAAARLQGRIDLSHLQVGIVGAEMIDPEIVDRVIDGGKAMGLAPEALAGGYGMAEAVLALTIAPMGTGINMDEVDPEELAASGRAVPAGAGRTKRIASCGTPLEGVELRIMGEDGPAGEREVGEIQAKAPCLMLGYRGPDAPDPFQDGWLKTGDQGYLVGEELFVTGRIKDIVIVTGKNYLPEDLEWAVSQVDSVRLPRSVAFNPPGEDGHVVIAVEVAGHSELEGIPRLVRNAVLNATGITPRTVVLIPKGSIPRTTSGKVRRAAIREAWSTGELSAMALSSDPVPGDPL